MYKLIIENIVIEKIDNFIDSYLNSFLNLFVDSGINNIDLITDNYEKSAKLFRDKIYFDLNNKLKEDIIGKKVLEYGYSTIIHIGNYRIFVYFEEKQKENIRLINDLKFYRK